jgi:hypothetical protein
MTVKLSSRSIAVAQAIGNREPFETYGALRAVRSPDYFGTGRLTDGDMAAILEASNGGLPEYVVFSYSTPIAVAFDNGSVWVNPNKYSVTTSKHQGKLYMLKGSS